MLARQIARNVASKTHQARFAARRVAVPARAFATAGARQAGSRGLPFAARAGVVLAGAGAAAVYGGSVHAGSSSVDWAKLKEDLENIYDDENSYNAGVDNFPGNRGGGGDVAPMMVRLAWHCCGSYSKEAGNGGSDGATMRFKPEASHGGNAGLGNARDLLEPIKAKYPGITYADLYIYAGKVAIEHMGGPEIAFKTGRTDAAKVAAPADDKRFSPDGRLPDGGVPDNNPDKAKTIQHLRDVFYRMGFNDQEIVALSGGHAMGRCHTDRSGYWGPWTRAPTTFSNEYFRLLVEEKWTPKKTHKGKKWTGPAQFEDPTADLMMLPTDMALTWDPSFNKYVQIYAKDEEKFSKDFAAAWVKLTENGCTGLSNPSGGGFLSWFGF